MDEKEFVQRSQKGDEDAFGVLVEKYKTKVYHLAYSLTQNAQNADDLAQEVFIKAYFCAGQILEANQSSVPGSTGLQSTTAEIF